MPAKNNNSDTGNNGGAAKPAKKYNPTITAFFDAPKFGIKDELGEGVEGTAFISTNIDAKAFETIQKHVSIGSKLLLRQAQRLNKNGGRTFYLEALPPLANETGYKGARKGTGNNGAGNNAGNAGTQDDI